jgi:FkbM family methyltransferase
LFVAAGRLSAATPHFRGKTRLFLLFGKILGLEKSRIRVRTTLRRPMPFEVELDLQAWAQRVAFLTGGYEADTVEFLLALHRAVGRDGWFLDIGANVGLIAIPFAKATQQRVIAVEAVPDNVAALRRNIAANELDQQITVLPFALGATPGVAQIQVEGDLRAGEGTGTANILPDGSTYECVRQEVDVRTLDGVTDLPRGCSLVKIDTDGYDLKILQGGEQFLERERPVIFGEFSEHCMGWHEQSVTDVEKFAATHRYDVRMRVQPGWQFRAYERGAAFVQDLLLVPHEYRDAVAAAEAAVRR